MAEQPQIPALLLDRPGYYLHSDDVALALRQMADSVGVAAHEDRVAGAALRTAALHFETPDPYDPPGPHEPDVVAPTPARQAWDELLAATLEDSMPPAAVYRVEVYPDDPQAEKPHWQARAVDETGRILGVTAGSFVQQQTIDQAAALWPDVDVMLVADAMVDTVWEQSAPEAIRSSHSGRRRPSPNRMWPT